MLLDPGLVDPELGSPELELGAPWASAASEKPKINTLKNSSLDTLRGTMGRAFAEISYSQFPATWIRPHALLVAFLSISKVINRLRALSLLFCSGNLAAARSATRKVPATVAFAFAGGRRWGVIDFSNLGGVHEAGCMKGARLTR